MLRIFSSGYLGPGGIHENNQHKGCVGGATGYLDKLILGERHVYPWPEPQHIWGSEAFDPEGLIGMFPESKCQKCKKYNEYSLLGTLPSIFQVFLGMQCGMILLLFKDNTARLKR